MVEGLAELFADAWSLDCLSDVRWGSSWAWLVFAGAKTRDACFVLGIDDFLWNDIERVLLDCPSDFESLRRG